MAVQIWKGNPPQHDSETRAVLKLAEDLGRLQGFYLLLANVYLPSADMDLIVLKHNGIFIVELKQCAQKLIGGMNGEWKRMDEKGNLYSFYAETAEGFNAYQQVCGYYFGLKAFLNEHKFEFLPRQKAQHVRFEYIKSVIAVSPFLHPNSEIDVDWRVQVLGLDELARYVFSATSSGLSLTESEMTALAQSFGCERWHDAEAQVGTVSTLAAGFFSQPEVSRSIVGRHAEQANLLDAILSKQGSIVCIGGEPGIGKTYLAGWLCEETKDEFSRILWLNCRSRTVTLSTLLMGLADIVESEQEHAGIIARDHHRRDEERIDAVLGPLNRSPSLLVLDDYDRCQGEGRVDTFLLRVAQICHNFKVIMTTRKRPAGLDNPKMPPNSHYDLTLEGIKPEYVKEYMRSRDILLDDGMAQKIWEKSSQGNPFAMSIIAARARFRPLTEVLESLPFYDDPDAQAWFVSLLSDLGAEEQAFLRTISVFETEVPVEAIKEVASTTDPWKQVEELIRRYLLAPSSDRNVFTVHRLLRDYCYWHQLDGSERIQLHARVGAFYQRKSNFAVTHREQSDSLVKAIEHFHKAQKWPDVISLAHQVEGLLDRQSDWETMERIYQMALIAAQKESSQSEQVWCHLELGYRETDAGRYAQANDHYQACIRMADEIGDHRSQSVALHRMGTVARLWGHYEEAVRLYEQSIEISETYKYELERAISFHQLGRVAHLQGRYQDAKDLYESSLKIKKSLHDQLGIAISLHQLGNLAQDDERYPEAMQYYRESLKIKNTLGDQQGICNYFQQMGRVARKMGEYKQAGQFFERALEIARRIGDQRAIGLTLLHLSELDLYLGRTGQAQQRREEGYAILKELDAPELAEWNPSAYWDDNVKNGTDD